MSSRFLPVGWRTLGLLIACGATVTGLLLAGLWTLTPRLTAPESATLRASAGLRVILADPLHLPLKLLQLPATYAPSGYEALLGRLASVLLGLFSFFIFMYIARRWHGRRSMMLGCVVFATSAWFLHTARFAGTEIEYLAAILAMVAIHVGLYDHDDSSLMFYVWLLTNLVLLFIPGFVWFVLLSLIWQWRVLIIAWRNLSPAWNRAAWCGLAIAGMAALALTLVHTPDLLRAWLGIPARFTSWQATLQQIGEAFAALVYRGPHNPALWLGRLPLLDAFLTAMLSMGVIFYIRHWQAARTRLLGSYLLLGGILVGLHGGVGLSIIVPVAYLVIVGGIAYSLHFWLRTFPRNQVARTVGIVGIMVLIGLSCFYNIRQYFIAWPRNPETVRILSRR